MIINLIDKFWTWLDEQLMPKECKHIEPKQPALISPEQEEPVMQE